MNILNLDDLKQGELPLNTLIVGNCLEGLKFLPNESVDLVVTSPPYWGLRDYGEEMVTVWDGDKDCEHEFGKNIGLIKRNESSGVGAKQGMECSKGNFCIHCNAWKGQLGLEPHPQMFLEHLWKIFDECKRVLKKSGSVYIVLGDTYCGSMQGVGSNGKVYVSKTGFQDPLRGYFGGSEGNPTPQGNKKIYDGKWLQPKQLMLIPSRFAIGMQERGWILRNDNIWHKCISGNTPIYAKSQGRVLRTSVRELARLPLDRIEIFGNGEWRKVIEIERQKTGKLLTIHLRNGMRIEVTPEHQFPIGGNLIEARNLKRGHKLLYTTLPNENGTFLGSEDVGWIVGFYLAEGSKTNKSIQFSIHKDEVEYGENLKAFSEKFAGSYRNHIYGNNQTVVLSGSAVVGIINNYVDGDGAKNKHLSRKAFEESNKFLRGALCGYLDGDGHYDKKNNRYRLGFTLNRELEYDLRTICNRLRYFMRAHLRKAKYQNGEKSVIRGEIRKTKSGHFNQKDDYEIKRIEKTRGITYHIEVDGDHLFALCDGTLTHNSNAMPSSVKDRLNNTYEHVFHFVKSRKYYFDLDAVREPHKSINELKSRKILDNKGNHEIRGDLSDRSRDKYYSPKGKNPGDVWQINTKPFPDAHFAVFPPELVEKIIKSSCPPKGIVLDPFAGSGTTLAVAKCERRNFIGFDIKPEYCLDIAENRIENTFRKPVYKVESWL